MKLRRVETQVLEMVLAGLEWFFGPLVPLFQGMTHRKAHGLKQASGKLVHEW